MKSKTLTQFITLSIMFAVLIMLVSLMPTQDSNDSANMPRLEQQITNAGMINNTGKQFQN